MQTQGPVVVTTVSTNPELADSRKKVLKGLGIAEVVLGCLAVLLDVIMLIAYGIPSNSYSGFWGGAWIIVAGGLGIAAGGPSSNACLINTHMGFSIVAAIFSGILMAIGFAIFPVFIVIGAIGIPGILITFIGLISFILCVVSASYCCCTNTALGRPACCGGCSDQPAQTVVVTQNVEQQQAGYPMATIDSKPPAYAADEAQLVQRA